MAVGLGSMDMPIPAVAQWEWLNWKFPRPVHAGDTIYARWTLTQKRAPVGGAPTAIVVWRVDVHTASGALCAEGEVGASVLRSAATQPPTGAEAPERTPVAEPAAAAATAAPPRRGRRRRRPATADGAKNAPEIKAAAAVEAPVQAASAAPASPERTATGTRRRRRRRPASATAARNGGNAAPAAAIEARAPAAAQPANTPPDTANPLTRAIRRLRRP